jgi:hypothetical protein
MIYMHAHLAQEVLFNINLALVINEYCFLIRSYDNSCTLEQPSGRNLMSQQHVNVPTNVMVNLSAMVHVTHAQKANLLGSD